MTSYLTAGRLVFNSSGYTAGNELASITATSDRIEFKGAGGSGRPHLVGTAPKAVAATTAVTVVVGNGVTGSYEFDADGETLTYSKINSNSELDTIFDSVFAKVNLVNAEFMVNSCVPSDGTGNVSNTSTAHPMNGIYRCTQVDAINTKFTATRVAWLNTGGENGEFHAGLNVFIRFGSTCKDKRMSLSRHADWVADYMATPVAFENNTANMASNAVMVQFVVVGDGASVANDSITAAHIVADAVGSSELANNAVDEGAIATGAVTVDKIGANAVSLAKMAQQDVGKIIVGQTSGDDLSVAISGDATLAADGALTIANDAVATAMIANDAVTADKIHFSTATDISTDAADGDSMLISDQSATNAVKRITIANLKTVIGALPSGANNQMLVHDGSAFVSVAMSGDVAIAAGGGTTIQANSVEQAMIVNDAVSLDKMAGLARGNIIHGNAGGDPTALSPGATDTVLRSDGSDVAYAKVKGTMMDIGTTAVLGAGAVVGDSIFVGDLSDANTVKSMTITQLGDLIGLPSGTDTQILVNASGSYASVAMTGDVAIGNGGATTIQPTSVEQSMIALNAVDVEQFAQHTAGHILVGASSGNDAFVPVSGDATLTSTGTLTIANDAVTADKIHFALATDISTNADDADSMLISDASDTDAVKKITIANLKTTIGALPSGNIHQILVHNGTSFVAASKSGDATIASGGVLTLAAAQTNVTSMLSNSFTKLGRDAAATGGALDFSTPNQVDLKFGTTGAHTVTRVVYNNGGTDNEFHVLDNGATNAYGYADEWRTPSDMRLKDIDSLVKDPCGKMLALDGFTFTFNGKDGHRKGKRAAGTSAQQLEKVLPEAVGLNSDTGFLTVTYDYIHALHIECQKELIKRNDSLRDELAELKAIVQKLAKRPVCKGDCCK
jgi:hypothetical protein